ncbi:hypothetical protein OESDEN_00182 [Oesophagostomum dentatum]|uniref:Uncharacterized protein n=1 Tax=Oesophagostomum dentatum TaxID=61180 RepID=A0A0B1TQL4_OESDE|nr:hypothetical protein OESDEN_00182 [Oesophagostomum dentatum]
MRHWPELLKFVADHEFTLFTPSVFQYPVPSVDANQFSTKKDVKEEFSAYLTQPSQSYSTNPQNQMIRTFTFTKQSDSTCNVTQDCQVR